MKLDLEKLEQKIEKAETIRSLGRVSKIIGLMIEAQGLKVQLGELCIIKSLQHDIKAEVVGFKDDYTLLMPLGEIHNIQMGAEVIPSKEEVSIKVGEELIGRVINALGEPIDKDLKLRLRTTVSQNKDAPNPLTRQRIESPLHFGVKAIDGILT
jgi:flagellar biosynthesis/type III secretory pathway ATPase